MHTLCRGCLYYTHTHTHTPHTHTHTHTPTHIHTHTPAGSRVWGQACAHFAHAHTHTHTHTHTFWLKRSIARRDSVPHKCTGANSQKVIFLVIFLSASSSERTFANFYLPEWQLLMTTWFVAVTAQYYAITSRVEWKLGEILKSPSRYSITCVKYLQCWFWRDSNGENGKCWRGRDVSLW